ncbi:MAG: YjbH domain-containing protein [Simkaniaceae bacterium]
MFARIRYIIIFLIIAPLFAEEDVSLLFRDLALVHTINQEIKDTLPFHYNYTLMGGYFNMPSARMNQAGMVALGFSYVPPYRNYGATIQALERLEFGINYRVYCGIPDPDIGKAGFGDFSDRGANIKFGVLRKEDGFPHFPEIAVGLEDFYGSKRFHAFYVVATKELTDYNLEITLGWGKGRIRGFFGGIGWTPFRKTNIPGINRLTVLAEWDAIDYKQSYWEHPKGKTYKSRINVGLSTTFFDMLQLSVSSLRGEDIAASASFNYNLGESKGLFPKVHNPPLYKAPLDTEPLGYLRSEREFAQELAFAFSEQGLNLYRIYLSGDTLWIKMINILYREEKDLKERIESILRALTPSNIAQVTVVIEADGVPTHEYRFRTIDLKRFRKREIGDFEFQTLAPMREPTPPPNPYEGTLLYHRTKRIWTFTIRPRLLTFFGSVTGKFKYSVGLVAGPEGYLFDQFYYKIQGAYNIKSSLSDVGDMDFFNPSQILNVRSDSIKYFQTNSLAIEQAYIQRGMYIKKGWYGRVATGYFEPAYAGVAAEVLYYPVGQDWAIGLESAGVLKRKYHGLGFTTKVRKFKGYTPEYEHFIGYQYFLDLYYTLKPLKLEFKVSLGKFLARDVGARFEIGRYFSSGFHFNVWYSWTNAHDIVNGARYRDKGVSFAIPLDFFLTKSSRTFIPYALSVWLRDTGARAATGKRLYTTIQEERESVN